jgi:hypothetical protein
LLLDLVPLFRIEKFANKLNFLLPPNVAKKTKRNSGVLVMKDDRNFGFASDVDQLNQFCVAFNERVPTKAQALELLCERLESIYGTQCTGCGSARTRRNGRIRKCHDCSKKRSVTAGTYFHNVRKVPEWVCMIESMDEGIVCNKADYHRATGLARSSASVAFNKITSTTHDAVLKDDYALEDSVTFAAVYGKRSSETPAREPPCAEEIEAERAAQTATTADPIEGSAAAEITPGNDVFDLMPQAKRIHELLTEASRSTEELIDACDLSVGDVLSGLAMLEIAGLVYSDPQGRLTVQFPSSTGAPAEATRNTAATTDHHLAAVAITFIRSRFHAVSRKYVQLYLVAHWWRRQKQLWKQGLIFSACAAAKYIRGRDLIKYVSPLRLKVAT